MTCRKYRDGAEDVEIELPPGLEGENRGCCAETGDGVATPRALASLASLSGGSGRFGFAWTVWIVGVRMNVSGALEVATGGGVVSGAVSATGLRKMTVWRL
jgi:hypothetical protein